jgi:hypothetical protein
VAVGPQLGVALWLGCDRVPEGAERDGRLPQDGIGSEENVPPAREGGVRPAGVRPSVTDSPRERVPAGSVVRGVDERWVARGSTTVTCRPEGVV